MNKHFSMKELREKIKEVLEDFDLPTRRFGVAITVDPDEFEILADQNPFLVHPEMLFFSVIDEMGNQSFIQIQKQHVIKNIPSE